MTRRQHGTRTATWHANRMLLAIWTIIVLVASFIVAPSVYAAGTPPPSSKTYTITTILKHAIDPHVCVQLVHAHPELAITLRDDGGCFTYSRLSVRRPLGDSPQQEGVVPLCWTRGPDITYDYDAYGPLASYDVHLHGDLFVDDCHVPRLDYEDCYVAAAYWYVNITLQQCTSWASPARDNSEYLMGKYWVANDGIVNYTEEQYMHIQASGTWTHWG